MYIVQPAVRNMLVLTSFSPLDGSAPKVSRSRIATRTLAVEDQRGVAAINTSQDSDLPTPGGGRKSGPVAVASSTAVGTSATQVDLQTWMR